MAKRITKVNKSFSIPNNLFIIPLEYLSADANYKQMSKCNCGISKHNIKSRKEYNWFTKLSKYCGLKEDDIKENRLDVNIRDTFKDKIWSSIDYSRLDWLVEYYEGMMWKKICKKLGFHLHPIGCFQTWKRSSWQTMTSYILSG